MSLRDTPGSHKIVIPLFAGLSIDRAYNPDLGGTGGPGGKDRTSLPESWVTEPGIHPACDTDPETDKHLVLWLDASRGDTLVLGTVPEPEEGELRKPFPILEWRDRSGRGNHAVAAGSPPKLATLQPFFAAAVDMSADTVCANPNPDPPPPPEPEIPTEPPVETLGSWQYVTADNFGVPGFATVEAVGTNGGSVSGAGQGSVSTVIERAPNGVATSSVDYLTKFLAREPTNVSNRTSFFFKYIPPPGFVDPPISFQGMAPAGVSGWRNAFGHRIFGVTFGDATSTSWGCGETGRKHLWDGTVYATVDLGTYTDKLALTFSRDAEAFKNGCKPPPVI